MRCGKLLFQHVDTTIGDPTKERSKMDDYQYTTVMSFESIATKLEDGQEGQGKPMMVSEQNEARHPFESWILSESRVFGTERSSQQAT